MRSHSDPQNTSVQIEATENHVLGVGFLKFLHWFQLQDIAKLCQREGVMINIESGTGRLALAMLDEYGIISDALNY